VAKLARSFAPSPKGSVRKSISAAPKLSGCAQKRDV